MKRIYLYFVFAIFAGLTLTSCKKNKDGTPLIVGEWELQEVKGILGGEVVGDEFDPGLCPTVLKFAEREWDTYDDCDGLINPPMLTGLGTKGTYTTNGIFLTMKDSDKNIEFTYSVTSNTLKLIYTPKGQNGTHDGVISFDATYRRK